MSGIVAGEHKVAAELRQAALRTPERLALLDVPSGTGGGEQTLGGGLAAAEKPKTSQQNCRAKLAKQMANGKRRG